MTKLNIRKPAVAGQFYSSSSSELKKQIEGFIDPKAEKTDAIACMLPHAGYMYSGPVAGATISRVKIKETVLLLGPNHTGYGRPFSLMSKGIWQTPLGEVQIDEELAENILRQSEYLEEDELGHMYEHSLEVELPFLQFFKKDLKIVPITIATQDIQALKDVGKAIANAVKKEGCLIVASSDMSHYLPQKEAEKKDRLAIEAILELDEDKLIQRIRQYDISMCGYAPATVMLSAAKTMGAKKAELVKYQTSGDIIGDHSSVVGYAGVIVY
jgi:hypothetical protein